MASPHRVVPPPSQSLSPRPPLQQFSRFPTASAASPPSGGARRGFVRPGTAPIPGRPPLDNVPTLEDLSRRFARAKEELRMNTADPQLDDPSSQPPRDGAYRSPSSAMADPRVHQAVVGTGPRITDLNARRLAMTSSSKEDQDHEVHPYQMFFAWLGWSPEPFSPCFKTLHDCFPHSLPGPAVLARVKTALFPLGMNADNTLYGQSICPDEINNEKGDLADLMRELWGEVFPLGGIGGVPFVGRTGYKAFSAHAPTDGHIVILFGPHIAIAASGEVGKYLRKGQCNHSTACGALIAAYGSCNEGKCGPDHQDPMDLQQTWLRDKLAPVVPEINAAQTPLAALACYSYDMVANKLLSIVDNEFGVGKLVLLGGIQINMPEGLEDHLMPLHFEVRQKGKEPIDLLATLDAEIGMVFDAQEGARA